MRYKPIGLLALGLDGRVGRRQAGESARDRSEQLT